MGNKLNDLDSFWDLSSLVPKKNKIFSSSHIKEPSKLGEMSFEFEKKDSDIKNDSVIVRYIAPNTDSERLMNQSQLTHVFEYSPEESLIHNVSVEKWKSSYDYYGTFLNNAVEYNKIKGNECAYVPFFSYVPQYDQLNKEQLEYYFWFRENVRCGRFIDTDISYLQLYIYEILNLGTRLDTKKTQYILTELWNEYHEKFPAISTKLSTWICDYSLLHKLAPPENAKREMIQATTVLKEFYIKLPKGDVNNCARSLIKYCSSYDFRTSKFFNDQSRELFDQMIVGALGEAVRFYSRDGEMLSELTFGDSYIERDVFAGAVCVSKEKYKIKVKYCSFSRSNELRFLVGDIIKYSENKLRAYMGIKSRLTVYSISAELRNILDSYFENNLPQHKHHKKKSEEKHEYDVLYETPKKKLSLSDAARIEEASWETTRELVEAFDDTDENVYVEEIAKNENNTVESLELCEKNPASGLESYAALLTELIRGHKNAVSEYAQKLGKMPDALVDEINEAAYDKIGDAIIDEDGNGGHVVIEDYLYLFE
ncbi:MAG: hypothetical protein E7607_01415 [Ruminococcaceae bacterium]|nr:hypothetical protein [Oscillospiraceae bacterium]